MARIAPNKNPSPEAQEKLNGVKAKLSFLRIRLPCLTFICRALAH